MQSTPAIENVQPTPSTSSGATGGERRDPLKGRRPSFLAGNYKGFGTIPVKGESFCSCFVISENTPGGYRYLDCGCGEDGIGVEWHWDRMNKSSAAEVLVDGKSVRFHVNYSCGTAAVKGDMPMTDGQYFWEIKMTAPVYGTDMMIGIGTDDVDLDAYSLSFCSMLGRNSDSWGFSYMGNAHHKGNSLRYGARFGQGSIIGVYLDMWHGTLSFYKNRKPLGIAFQGLQGKKVYPMVSSTAAQSGMKLIQAVSFNTSLQFMCCQVLRNLVPLHQDVCDALVLPPGLRDFLANNLSWLLQPCLPPDKEEPADLGRDGEEEAGSPASTVDLDSDSDTEEEEEGTTVGLASTTATPSAGVDNNDPVKGSGTTQAAAKHTDKLSCHSDAELSNARESGIVCVAEGGSAGSTDQGRTLGELDNSSSAQNNRNVRLPVGCASGSVSCSGSGVDSDSQRGPEKAVKRKMASTSEPEGPADGAKKPKSE